ncbi:MAG: GNAT family N-acetyltransferase [Asticcacaulis sp.]|nr:GNAT family N-acetyltransferase [Asticcacaulis sp.]
MSQTIDCLCPQELTPADEARWTAFVAGRDDLTGPYFDVRYVKAIAAAVPCAGIARVRDGDAVVAYFPYQLRARVMQPLGAPLSDYHGLIAASGTVIDFDALLRATGARRLEFQGWIGPAPEVEGVTLRRRVADIRQGFDAWWQVQDHEHHKFFKNIGRCQRNVEKDFGGFAFTWDRVTPDVMDWVLSRKREQYRESGMHDVFGCGWTRRMLDALAIDDAEGYGLRAGVFRHDGKIVAAEIGLVGGGEVHLWFPSYDPAFYRYSVGILLAVAIIEAAAKQGLHRVDFGTGGEDYKAPLTVDQGECREAIFEPHVPLIRRAADVAIDALPLTRCRIAALRLSLHRRVSLIRATETNAVGWGRALVSMGQRFMVRRNTARTAR